MRETGGTQIKGRTYILGTGGTQIKGRTYILGTGGTQIKGRTYILETGGTCLSPMVRQRKDILRKSRFLRPA
jgi:hypothetical protein